MFIVFASIAVAALLVFIAVRLVRKRKGRKSTSKKNAIPPLFLQKVLAAGFTPQETTSLYDMAVSVNVDDPTAFLWSYKSLDAVVKLAMQNLTAAGKISDPAPQSFLGKLLERRKHLTIQRINAQKILSNSREMMAGQNVQVVLTEVGVFVTQVLANTSYFSVLSPIIADLPPDFKWENRKVMILFRRANDGEYSFNTTVVREIEDEKTGDFVLLMRHQSPLFRTQKRKSIRVQLKKQAHIYPVDNDTGETFAEGKSCTLRDLSDDGCSLTMEGKVNMPRVVIVQFTLAGQLVSINGTCLSVQYNRVRNISLLHIKLDSVPRDIKNIILSVMFGIISDSNDPTDTSETSAEKTGEGHQSGESAKRRLHHEEIATSSEKNGREEGQARQGDPPSETIVVDNHPAASGAEQG